MIKAEQDIDTPFVSVVIAMRNEAAFVEKCLDSLTNQSYPNDRFEIVIVDGRSTDRSLEIVKSYATKFHNLRVKENEKRIATRGWNIGVAESRGEVIILMSAHAYVERDFITDSVRRLSTTGADCVGGRVHSIGNSYLSKAISSASNSPFGMGNARYRYYEKGGFVETAAFGAYPRTVFENVGNFDESLQRDGDWDFNYRIRRTGGKIFLAPEIKSYLHTRNDLTSLFKQQFLTSFWKVRVLRKYPESILPRHLIPAVFVLCLVGGTILTIYFNLFLYLTIGLVAIYMACLIVFSAKIALRNSFSLLFALPLVFLCIHISYGLGFFAGLVRFGLPDLKAMTKSLLLNLRRKDMAIVGSRSET